MSYMVRKRIAVVICLLCVLHLKSSLAQSTTTYRFGITVGPNASYWNTERSQSELLWRYQVGVTLEQRFSTALALSYRLVYNRLGGQLKSPTYGTAFFNFDYINLPILGRINPRGSPIFVEAGVQAGYLLKAQDYVVSSTTPRGPMDWQNINYIDTGVVGGLGWAISRHWLLNAHYYYGLRSIKVRYQLITDPTTGISTRYEIMPWYNRSGSLSVTYYF